MNFNRATKTALAYAGASIQDLADHWGITRQAATNRLKENDPKYRHIIEVCEFCNVKKEDFMKWGE